MKGKDQYTYLEFPKGNCAAPPVLVARSAGPSGFKGKEFQEELAPFTGDLSKVKMESTFEFLECKNITKDLKVNVLSGGATHLSLSGPLTELLSADEPNLSKHVENHTRLSALKATVAKTTIWICKQY